MPFIAHPAFLVMGAYATYMLAGYGVDPLLAGMLLMPVFFVIGLGVYQFYYSTFEGRGSDQGLRGIAFFCCRSRRTAVASKAAKATLTCTILASLCELSP